jgi:hypothetical protein
MEKVKSEAAAAPASVVVAIDVPGAGAASAGGARRPRGLRSTRLIEAAVSRRDHG